MTCEIAHAELISDLDENGKVDRTVADTTCLKEIEEGSKAFATTDVSLHHESTGCGNESEAKDWDKDGTNEKPFSPHDNHPALRGHVAVPLETAGMNNLDGRLIIGGHEETESTWAATDRTNGRVKVRD